MTTFWYELMDFDLLLQEEYAEAMGAAEITSGLLEGMVDASDSVEARDLLLARMDKAGLSTNVNLTVDVYESEV